MERVRSAYEKLEDGEIFLVSLCPFCHKANKIHEGNVVQQCEHFVREGHGCGGTVFIFKDRTKPPVEEMWR